jgi:uncharacterized UPF0146 family protein
MRQWYACRAHKYPDVDPRTLAALRDRLSAFDSLVEVGIGRRLALAAALADAGCTVVATDIRERETPESVAFVRDDVTDPDLDVYRGADAVCALNCPPELHRPTREIARAVDAAFLFTTLGGDPATVPVERETLPGETLFVAVHGP